jgi:ABC-type transport system substrate-binding protein
LISYTQLQGGKFYPYGGYWEYGEQIATNWKAVGISVELVLLDRPAWLAQRDGGKMKGTLFVDNPLAPTIGGRLAYLFSGTGSYGNYPEIQALWDQSPEGRIPPDEEGFDHPGTDIFERRNLQSRNIFRYIPFRIKI